MDPRGPEKKERLLNALNLGMVMVHLDARRPGVVVPQALRGEAHLRLNLSYRFDPPDLSVNEWGVRQTLSFGGSRFGVAIPWSALFAVTSHTSKEFWMFLEDLPPELLDAVPPATGDGPRPVGRPQLRTVGPLTTGQEDGPEEVPAPPKVAPAPAPVPEPERASPPRPVPGLAAARPLEPQPPPAGQGGEGVDPPRDEPPKPRDRSHLRVVK